MNIFRISACAVSCSIVAAMGCSSVLTRVSDRILSENAAHRVVAFVGADVMTMESDTVLTDQTVIVEDGLIASISPRRGSVIPEGARVIDARGTYLLPGLIDMHVHISDDEDLLLLVANGVTTVRNMADLPGWVKTLMGFSDVLSLREEVSNGEIVGPEIYTAGLVLDGSPPVSPFNEEVHGADEIRKEVYRQKRRGYDLIKVYDMLSPEDFETVLLAAREASMPVAGHVPFAAGIDAALASDMVSIEHMTGYINNNISGFIIPQDSITAYAARSARTGIFQTPTLCVWDNLPPEDGIDSLEMQKEFAYLSWRIQWLWGRTLGTVYDIDSSLKAGYPARMMEISKRMARALYDEGCTLMVGTDMNFVGVYPGTSTVREIELLVEAGLTPMDALKAATVNAARCLGRLDRFGTVTAGSRADLLLLDADPLKDIGALRDPVGVMVKGVWIDRQAREAIFTALR